MWYKNIAGRFFGLVTKHACDRRTDGQNYDSQDRTSIASSGKNYTKLNYIICYTLMTLTSQLLPRCNLCMTAQSILLKLHYLQLVHTWAC